MFKRTWNTQLTANDATQKEELGVIREEYDATYGYRKFIYVQAASDTTVAEGTVVGYSDRKKATVSSDLDDFNPNQVAGVGIGAITASYYGWIQIYGYHGGVKTNGDDDIVDGMALVLSPATDGVCDGLELGTDTAGLTYSKVGVAVADDVDGDNTVSAFLDC